MSLAPLLEAPFAIQVHALAALGAFGIGAVQLAGTKGTPSHRALGWTWVALMATVAVSSFWIHEGRQIGPFSFIHGLSLYTLAMLPLAVMHARRGRIRAHRGSMIGIFVGALVVAGLFTLLPGRRMHEVIFGG